MKSFLNSIKKGFFPFLIAFSALSVSASAAFYSVTGLSKLFAGASLEVIIMAGSLEVSKLVIASLLYQYWDTLIGWLKYYLSIACFILVIITSAGIYGFLSAAYQETANKANVVDKEIAFLSKQKDFYQEDVDRYEEELRLISQNISNLSQAKVANIQIKDTAVAGGVRNTISTAELRLARERLVVEENNRSNIQSKRNISADSLKTIEIKILNLESNTDLAAELGPLKYLQNLTGISMDRIINYLLLIIIFVFDPLAISLVVAANFAFARAFPTLPETRGSVIELEESEEEDEDEDKEEEKIMTNQEKFDKDFGLEDWEDNDYYETEDDLDYPGSLDEYTEEDEQRMNIIGQNGNDGEHYDDSEIKKSIDNLEDDFHKITEKTNEDLGKFYGLQTEIKDKLTENEKEISSINKRIESIDEYLEKNAPYYGEKAEATKSIEDFYGEEKPAPEEPKKKVTKLYDWNKLDRSSPNYTDPKEEEGGGKIY